MHLCQCAWFFAAGAISAANAFVGLSQHASTPPQMTATSLHAVPPFIIGPMIKKMRAEQEKKKMPMADRGEAARESPGLRIGEGVWKWPPVWPYDEAFFRPSVVADGAAQQQSIRSMASMLSGVAQVPGAASAEEEEEEEAKFDALRYWAQEKAAEPTAMDPEAIDKLKAHYSFYLRDGMSILELGAAEDSYLPDDLKPSRLVGVGASRARMDANPALTGSLVVDLNKVVADRDVDSDDLRKLAQEPFDAVIMSNTVEFLTHPREVFRSAWYLLKPGGLMIVSFSGKEATKDKFTEAQTKAWRDYNDDQHMWMTGSFFQFSAGDGWERLLGFDISPDSAQDVNADFVAKAFKGGKANNLFVVQANKGYQDERIDPDNVERSISSLCWMLPVMEERDKTLLLPRMTRAYETTQDETVKQAMERNIPLLPVIYESLVKMDTFAFTFSMQSQLATDLICDPDFTANEEQILNLQQGLGLRTPSPEFWVPIGENTSAMNVEERISLLGYIVPRFGSGNPAQEEALNAFVSGLKPTYAVIREKCPDLAESDVQLLGTDLLASEVLKPGKTTRDEFAEWLVSLSEEDLRQFLSGRKSIRENAREELTKFQDARAEQERIRKEMQDKYNEQVKKAREERSMIFNPRTQKMEVFDNPNKKKSWTDNLPKFGS